MKIIRLHNGSEVMVDDEDYEWLNDLHGWVTNQEGHIQLALRNNERLNMARMIMFAPEDKVVFHKDRNKLNNQKSNLVVCTTAEMLKIIFPHKKHEISTRPIK